MMNLSFGGDNEYVDSAARAAGSSGPGGLIASVLDLLGIHKQVAKAPEDGSKEASNPGDKKKSSKNDSSINLKDAPAPAPVSALTQAESALNIQPLPITSEAPGGWDQRYMSAIQPVDPNLGFVQGMFDSVFGKR